MGSNEICVERRFEARPGLVWCLLSDTNRFDRQIGFGVPRYVWREIDGRRQHVGTGTQAGLELEWIEEPYEWIEGRTLVARREFLKGPTADGGVRVSVEPDGDGALAKVVLWGEPRSLALKIAAPIVRLGLRRRIGAYFDAIAEVLGEVKEGAVPSPAASGVYDAMRNCTQPTLSGDTTPTDATELQRRADQLQRDLLDASACDKLVEALRSRPDEEVAQMRPFELARTWELDRREVLRAFLYATQAGLVDLNWQLNCPVCKVSAGVVRTLGEVERAVHCEACNIGYDNDFSANIEAVFRCNRALRDVQPAVYCAASPSLRPHVVAQLRLPAGEERELELPIDDARLHVRTLAAHTAADYTDPEPPAELHVRVRSDRVELSAKGKASGEPTRLVLASETQDDTYVLLERGAWSADLVLGSVIASMPEFIDLFATEAPASGLDLSVSKLTFLFSDLTGSTALYERIGDAKAYALVQEHFRQMEAAITRGGGAIVKTMGDAVMATFASPLHAVNAALEVAATDGREHEELGIGIKLGVHEGACLAVRANERLDYFGTTVNVAARLQGKASSGTLVMLADLAADPPIAAALKDKPSKRFDASLKGIEGTQSLVAFDLYSTS